MSRLTDHTTSQLVEAILGNVDLVRSTCKLVPTADESLLRATLAAREIGRRETLIGGVC